MPFHNSNRIFHFLCESSGKVATTLPLCWQLRQNRKQYPAALHCVRPTPARHEHLPPEPVSGERIPCAQFLQCFFRINASRDMFRITNREATAIQQRSPVGFAVDGEIFLLAGFRCYNDQAIAEQCLARSRIDRFLSTA